METDENNSPVEEESPSKNNSKWEYIKGILAVLVPITVIMGFIINQICILKNAAIENAMAEAKLSNYKFEQSRAEIQTKQAEIERLKSENEKYEKWLIETPTNILFYENKIKELEDQLHKQEPNHIPVSAWTGHLSTENEPYSIKSIVKKGDTFTDQKTGMTFSIINIFSTSNADIHINLLDKENEKMEFDKNLIKIGDRTHFVHKNKQYILTVEKINYISDTCEISIKELE